MLSQLDTIDLIYSFYCTFQAENYLSMKILALQILIRGMTVLIPVTETTWPVANNCKCDIVPVSIPKA